MLKGSKGGTMSFLQAHTEEESVMSQYATSDDFRKLFTEDAHSLYLLSFVLTGNHRRAEQCFVAGLDESANGNSVFQEWAHSWARRVIVRNAIRMMAPHPSSPGPGKGASPSAGKVAPWTMLLLDARFSNVLALEDFERFVYVLSVLERYAEQECAALLSTSRKEIRETRLRAIQHIADFDRKEISPFNDCEACKRVGRER
jgi:hypothetical protein